MPNSLSIMPVEFKKLYSLFSYKERLKFLALFFMMLLAAVLEVAGIGMVPGFVGIVADPERVMQYEPVKGVLDALGITNSRDLLVWGSVLVVSIFVIKNFYLIVYSYIESKFVNSRMYHIAYRLMRSYMMAPYTFHLQRNTAELLRNTNEESKLLIDRVVVPSLRVAREGIMAISIIIFLFTVEPFITLAVFLLLGIATGLFLLLTQKRITQYGREEQKYRRDMIKSVNQGLGGLKEARILNREDDFIEKFRISAFHRSRLLAFQQFITQVPKPIVETIAVGGMMLISLLMVWQGRPMSTIIPILSLFAMATVRLMPAIHKIANNYTKLRYNFVSVNPIYDDLTKLWEYQDQFLKDRNKKNVLDLKNVLEVENVHYHYPNSEEQALDGISFSLTKGQAVAFVGASGAGKTTMVDLLLGLLKPSHGNIKVDGQNIYESLSAWQHNIGYIPQSIYLSDETLRNNIAFGVPDDQINDKQIWKAVKLSQLEELVYRMPKGLDTIIGEQGTLLSGGQQQRVGIARALYHNPQVLVMDEATSALDNVTEKYIMKAIDRLKKDRTIIMIAHRLTTVKNCDQLYFMEAGNIIEKGTYLELLDKSPKFQEMAMESDN